MACVLPSPPETLMTVVRLAGDESTSVGQLTRVIERDTAFTASLLQLANSAAYGIGRPVRTVQQAGVLLGTRCIRSMALNHAVRVATADVDVGALDAESFWEGSLRRGVAARLLAENAGFEDPSEAFTLGMIQDIGLLEMAARWKESSGAVADSTLLPDPDCLEAERRATGVTHPEVFEETAQAWGLPTDIVTVVAHHHAGLDGEEERRVRRLVEICRAADVLARVVQADAAGESVARAQAALATLRSRTPLAFEPLVDAIGAEVARDAEEFGIRVKAQPTIGDLLAVAARSLARLNLSYEQLTRRLRDTLVEKERLALRLEASNATLRRLSATDGLTEVANRRAFVGALEHAIADSRQTRRPLSLLMADLDHFKDINDTWGHGNGDDVLRAVCRRFEERVRADDLVGRLGGEEFAVLLRACDAERGREIAERLRGALRADPVATGDGANVPVTASFGGVTITVAEGADVAADDLLRRCDRALYQSKRDGRDRVTWAD